MKGKVTIGIPVYNEEDNIVALLESVFAQNYKIRELAEVIIYDDKSSDTTVRLIESFTKSARLQNKVRLIRGKANRGKAFGLQQIFNHVETSYLVTLDSDVVLQRDGLVDELLAAMINNGVGLASGWSYYPIPQMNLFIRSFSFSLDILEIIGRTRPFYVCWGGLMGFTKDFIKKIRLPEKLFRIDGYLYMESLRHNRGYLFVKTACVEDKKDFSNMTMSKYANIQSRSHSYPDAFLAQFERSAFNSETYVSFTEKVHALLEAFGRKPMCGLAYIFTKVGCAAYKQFNNKGDKVLWRS